MKTVSMRDVAQVAGVSLATVSYVVNQGPKPVSAEMRERVLRAMGELGYQGRRRGRSRSRPLTVGAIVPDATNSFFSQALAGVEATLRERGHLLLVGSSDEDPVRELELVTALTRGRAAGLILTPCTSVPREVERLAAGGLPVTLMDREDGETTLNRVVMDNYQSAFRATRLLAESGYRRIALINGPEHITPARDRLRGYRDALQLAELSVASAYVRLGPFTFDHGRQSTLDLLSLANRPEAIFSSSAILTTGVLAALRERRLHWPEDIAIVGFGDAAWASLVTPTLTVIEQPARQLGEVAARLLLATEAGPGSGQRVVLDSHLVLRESHWRPARVLEGGR